MQKYLGNNPQKVIDILLSRKQNNYTPQKDNDGNKVGLVIEGGALRGVISCAFAEVLFDLGLAPYFDEVYGNSSGALNAVYFVTGQIHLARTIYIENATDKRCTNILKFPDILNVDWLVDNWVNGAKALDIDSLSDSPTEVFLAVTNIITGLPDYFTNRDKKEIMIPILKATSYSPMFVTKTQKIKGESYNDGLVNAAIPVEKALSNECTHVLALLTRPFGYRKKKKKLMSRIENFLLKKYTDEYRKAFLNRSESYNRSLDILEKGSSKLATFALIPQENDTIPKATDTNPDSISKAAGDAYNSTKIILTELINRQPL